ncbi:hypothetical protein ACP9HP_002167 [Escherichia coli]
MKKELLYIVSMLTIPLSVSAISEELKFNYLGKPVSSSNGYSPMYLQGIYASRDTFGMRQSAVVASFKANSKNPFSFPVLGINSLYGLVDYKDRDSVALYADNTAPDYNGWEILSADKITPTSILSNSIDPTLIKPGMIIETKTNPKWTTYVISVTKGKIITSGWVNMQTRHMGYPKAQTLLINPLTKIWAANFNITIPENSRSVKGVVQENGIVNNKINNGIINGIDTVILPYSKYGGSSAYVARSANTGLNQQWENGFLSLGNKFGFVSLSKEVNHVNVSFLDASNADIGVKFLGSNKKHSIEWSDGQKVTASISPSGEVEKINYKTKVIKSNDELTDSFSQYIFMTKNDITVQLPESKLLTDGYTLKLLSIGDGKCNITFTSDVKIIGEAEYKNFNWHKEIVFLDHKWYLI